MRLSWMLAVLFLIGYVPIGVGQQLLLPGASPPGSNNSENTLQIVKPAITVLKEGQRQPIYRLISRPGELRHGNAAPHLLRAVLLARQKDRARWTDEEYKWINSETPIDSLPVAKAETFVKQFQNVLSIVDEASLYDDCDWGLPPITIQNFATMLIPDIQEMRMLSQILVLRCRLQIAQGKFTEAIDTIRVGLALARHVGKSEFLIGSLVGIAIGSMMLERVEELIQRPGAPNLYWALAQLPTPLIDVRPAIRSELDVFDRSFPQLRQASTRPMTTEQVNALVDSMLESMQSLNGLPKSDLDQLAKNWSGRATVAALGMKLYPEAKNSLLEKGIKPATIEAMPALQTVLIHMQDQYDEIREDILHWMELPPWQARSGFVASLIRATKTLQTSNPIMAVLLPAVDKVYEAQMRLDWRVTQLRTAEMIRYYLSRHGGKLPTRLADVTDLPAPINPFTGKDFSEGYRVGNGIGILEIPSPFTHSLKIGRRYEFKPTQPANE